MSRYTYRLDLGSPARELARSHAHMRTHTHARSRARHTTDPHMSHTRHTHTRARAHTCTHTHTAHALVARALARSLTHLYGASIVVESACGQAQNPAIRGVMAAFEGTGQPIDYVNEDFASCALDFFGGVVADAVEAIQASYDEVTNRWST